MNLLLMTLVINNLLRAQTAAASEGHYLGIYPNVSELVTVPLYFGLMLSLSGDDQSSGALAGVQAALDDINSRDDLLPGYSLHYTLTDSKVLVLNHYTHPLEFLLDIVCHDNTQCDRTAALNGFFTQLLQPPQNKLALIGSGCSVATEATAQIAHYYNITQVGTVVIETAHFMGYNPYIP